MRVVQWELRGTSSAAGFLADDPVGLAAVYAATDALPDDPCPPTSAPWGEEGYRRLHLGRYRVLYRIETEVIRVYHVGRVGR